MAIALSKGTQEQDVQCLKDKKGRFLFLNCKLDDKIFTLGFIYAPNAKQLVFLKDTVARLAKFQTGEVILAGI